MSMAMHEAAERDWEEVLQDTRPRSRQTIYFNSNETATTSAQVPPPTMRILRLIRMLNDAQFYY